MMISSKAVYVDDAGREWYFVKRALDRRPAALLASRGTGADHPTAAANIAALVRTVAGLPGHEWQEVLLEDSAAPELGRHPWHKVPPVVLDTHAAEDAYVHRDDP